MSEFIVGFVIGVAVVPVYWIFSTIGWMMIPAWKENLFAGFLGVVFCAGIPLSLMANLHQSNVFGLVVGAAASGIWFYKITKAKR